MDELRLMQDENIETLFKAIPPYETIENGHGYMGVLLRNKNDDTIQCHICGKWFKDVGNHTYQRHGLSAKEYKEKYGFVMSIGLCGRELSAKRRANMQRLLHDGKMKTPTKAECKKALEKANKKTRSMRRLNRKYGRAAPQQENMHATCREQLKHRYLGLCEMLGKEASALDARKFDGGLRRAARHKFGSWGNLRKECGSNDFKTPQKFSDEALLSFVRKKAVDIGRVPKEKDFIRASDGYPQRMAFVRRFGSWNRTLSMAGVHIRQKWGKPNRELV